MDITDLVFIDQTGYHFSDYPSFLTWLQDSYRGIYGADVYLEADSQDGQLLAIMAKAFYDTAALGASVYNSFSPTTAQGVGLSRNVKINGLNRQLPTNSTVDLTIVGTAATIITNGIAIDILNQKWDLPVTVLIPDSGTITVTCTAELPGAIRASANTVTGIFTPTRGWQTVNNASDASPGAPTETDADLRIRQSVSTANPSLTVFDGTVGGVANITGVTNVRGYENDSGTTDGNGIPGHNIALVVEGGDITAICQEILLHKTPGVGTFGTTSETVFDAHGMPVLIAFSRPTQVEITVEVAITTGTGFNADFIDQIKQSVVDAINQIGIGNDVLYTKLFIAAYLVGTPAYGTFDIDSVEIARDGGGVAAANVDIAWNELSFCQLSDVTVDT